MPAEKMKCSCALPSKWGQSLSGGSASLKSSTSAVRLFSPTLSAAAVDSILFPAPGRKYDEATKKRYYIGVNTPSVAKMVVHAVMVQNLSIITHIPQTSPVLLLKKRGRRAAPPSTSVCQYRSIFDSRYSCSFFMDTVKYL